MNTQITWRGSSRWTASDARPPSLLSHGAINRIHRRPGGTMTTQSRALRGVGPLVTAYAVVTVLTTVVSWRRPAVGGGDHQSQSDRHGDPIWIDARVRWDSNWYGGIAENGYFYHPGQQSPSPSSRPTRWQCVWSPSSSGTSRSPGSWSRCCGAASLVLFWRWLDGRVTSRARRLATASPHGLPLRLSSSMGRCTATPSSCSASWRPSPPSRPGTSPLAGLFIGAVATAAAGGPGPVAGLVVRTLEMLAQSTSGRDKVSFRELARALTTVRPRHTLVGLSVAGLIGWMAYLWFVLATRSPSPTRSPPRLGPGCRTTNVVQGRVRRADAARTVGHQGDPFAQFFVCLLAVLAIPQVFRRFGWGYLTYAVIVLGIPLVGSKGLLGMWPLRDDGVPGLRGPGALLDQQPRRWIRVAVPAVSALALLVATFFYGLGS